MITYIERKIQYDRWGASQWRVRHAATGSAVIISGVMDLRAIPKAIPQRERRPNKSRFSTVFVDLNLSVLGEMHCALSQLSHGYGGITCVTLRRVTKSCVTHLQRIERTGITLILLTRLSVYLHVDAG